MEYKNPKTIGHYNIFQQWMVSFFQSVTMRTAGFSTISYVDTHPITNVLYMLQMIIGGAPGGTAGGVKVTAAAITFLLFKAELTGQTEVTFLSRHCQQGHQTDLYHLDFLFHHFDGRLHGTLAL